MLTVDDYARIRTAYRDGMSIRAIARTFHHSRRKVRQMLAEPEPKPYTRTGEPALPVLGPFCPMIDEILIADEQAPRKQRHTAAQIFRRLRNEHGYGGSYPPVQRYVARQAARKREVFIPLSHEAGQRMESDFGHIHVDFPGGRRLVPVLVLSWSYSHCPFVMGLPTERTEAILEGMVRGLEYFGSVPREVWWDNPTTVVSQLLRGRERRLHKRYAALASHYRFQPLFCLPRRGNEKPNAENLVRAVQSRFAAPVPVVQNLAELNERLQSWYLSELNRTPADWNETIADRFARDRAASAPLPAQSFDPCIYQEAQVDKYQTVRFDSNRYSVPRSLAFQRVTVKGYAERVEIVAGVEVVARHERSYERGQQLLDPLHYLVTLSRRPAALDPSTVYRNWQLPSIFGDLRESLEKRLGLRSGVRHYIRVLQLLAEHPVERVEAAIGYCRGHGHLEADCISRHTQRLAARSLEDSVRNDGIEGSSMWNRIQVPVPDLSRFDMLLARGEVGDVQLPSDVIEEQFEAIATSGNVVRV